MELYLLYLSKNGGISISIRFYLSYITFWSATAIGLKSKGSTADLRTWLSYSLPNPVQV
jgi:hypothetical protein